MATHGYPWLPDGYPMATRWLPSKQPTNDQQTATKHTILNINSIEPPATMATMSVCNNAGMFGTEPAERHPLVGHADSDTLVNYPKFDCIGKEMVMTKVATITQSISPGE